MTQFQEHIPLSRFTSFCIGGPARYFFAPKDTDELKAALQEIAERRLPLFILGGGTNLLISDRGFRGAVIKPEIRFIRARGTSIEVGAGALMNDLLEFAAEKELSGLEWAGGLPGTVGGAIRGNAGAFGGEVKDSVFSVRSIDCETYEERERANAECAFAYRSSVFKTQRKKEIILSATFVFAKGNKKKIQEAMKEKIAYRAARHPMEYPNAGSVFKNIPLGRVPAAHLAAFRRVVKDDPFPVVPAAYLLAEAGLKGVACGGAMISARHPNFLVNALGATSADVRALIELAKFEVKTKFEIELEEEIIRV